MQITPAARPLQGSAVATGVTGRFGVRHPIFRLKGQSRAAARGWGDGDGGALPDWASGGGASRREAQGRRGHRDQGETPPGGGPDREHGDPSARVVPPAKGWARRGAVSPRAPIAGSRAAAARCRPGASAPPAPGPAGQGLPAPAPGRKRRAAARRCEARRGGVSRCGSKRRVQETGGSPFVVPQSAAPKASPWLRAWATPRLRWSRSSASPLSVSRASAASFSARCSAREAEGRKASAII